MRFYQIIIAVAGAALALSLSPISAAAQYDRYGVHEATAPVPAPSCGSRRDVACFVDSTRHYSDECCMRISEAKWLILATAGDSLEFFGSSATVPAILDLALPGKRSWQERLRRSSAPFVRLRIPTTSAYVLSVTLDLSDAYVDSGSVVGVPYEVRIASIGQDSLPRRAPLLRILGGKNTRVELRLRGIKQKTSPSLTVVVPADNYRIFAPAADSLELCRVPCRQPQVVGLRASGTITARP